MTNLKQFVTITLLGFFLFVKLSPQYFIAQTCPSFGTEKPAREIRFGQLKHSTYVINVDKSISENEPTKAVPPAKFCGQIFGLLLLRNHLTCVNSRKLSNSFPAFITTDTHGLQGCLRL